MGTAGVGGEWRQLYLNNKKNVLPFHCLLLIILQCSVKGYFFCDICPDYPVDTPEYLCTLYTPALPSLTYASVAASPSRLGTPVDRAVFYLSMPGTGWVLNINEFSTFIWVSFSLNPYPRMDI